MGLVPLPQPLAGMGVSLPAPQLQLVAITAATHQAPQGPLLSQWVSGSQDWSFELTAMCLCLPAFSSCPHPFPLHLHPGRLRTGIINTKHRNPDPKPGHRAP